MAATPTKLGRRVLGEVCINTSTPTKLSPTDKTALSSDLHCLKLAESPANVLAGKKRGIDEVSRAGSPVEPRRAPAERVVMTHERVETQTRPRPERSTAACEEAGESPTTTPAVAHEEVPAKGPSHPATPTDREIRMNHTKGSLPTPPSQPSEPSYKDQAETLRLRLKVALFKVQTNQTNVPLDELRIIPRHQSQQPGTCDDLEEGPLEPDQADTQARAGATNLPLIAEGSAVEPDEDLPIPSSPPSSPSVTVSPVKERATEPEFATPLPSRRTLRARSSSPPDSEGREDRRAEVNLTSSVVKGRAANGLLSLMRMG
ncbi:MAG: hypothetical protein M1817_004896 [Caeruleum heppii]|nr:MAG: hypothetical protein M1817_004896 [Caeruleum heppii]